MIDIEFSWFDLVKTMVALLFIYALLNLIVRGMKGWKDQHRIWEITYTFGNRLLVIFEPLAILILACIFLFINPLLHGVILGLILIVAFPSIRNYMLGRLFHLDRNIATGKRIKAGNTKGVIVDTRNMGLFLQTNEGLEYINYSKLLNDGYAFLSGDEVGGFYHFRFTPKDNKVSRNKLSVDRLKDLLCTAPYINVQHLPQLSTALDNSTIINGKIMLKQETYLNDFIQLVEEWGYQIELRN